jgi:hypothetical protein
MTLMAEPAIPLMAAGAVTPTAGKKKNNSRLVDRGIGFGRKVVVGRDGCFYVVIDPVNPKPGTMRHAVI